MPKFNKFPEDSQVIDNPEGDTMRVHESDALDLDQQGHLGDWETRQEGGATVGYVQLKMPILFVDDSCRHILIPHGHYLHYGHEGFYVWSKTFHDEIVEEAGADS